MIGDIRHIFVIESLFDDDSKSGEELYNDVIRRRIDGLQRPELKMTHRFHKVISKNELIEYLRYIATNAGLMSNGILIHLEIHGSDNRRGLVLNDQSPITWFELVACFREINIASRNQLYLSMASCYGRFLYEGVEPELKSPYSGYISASREVLVDEIIENFSEMFISLIEQGNLIQAYISTSKEGSNFFYKDSKATFDDLMIITKYRMKNDPSFRSEVFNSDIFNHALKKEWSLNPI